MVQLNDVQRDKIADLIRLNTPVLVCPGQYALVQELEQLVHVCGGISLIPPQGYTWKDLFRLAFSRRATVVIGEPRIIWGLYKLVRAYGITLKIKTAVLLCDHNDLWLADEIAHGLDCKVHCIYCKEEDEEADILQLEKDLLSWTSVLDCQIQKGESGLELKVVYFSGERLPKFPSCAKLLSRPWLQNLDEPFSVISQWNNG